MPTTTITFPKFSLLVAYHYEPGSPGRNPDLHQPGEPPEAPCVEVVEVWLQLPTTRPEEEFPAVELCSIGFFDQPWAGDLADYIEEYCIESAEGELE